MTEAANNHWKSLINACYWVSTKANVFGSMDNLGAWSTWFASKVVIPLSPLLVVFITDKIHHYPADWMRVEAILAYTIILPVIYLESSKGAGPNLALWIGSTAGVALYVTAHGMTHEVPPGDPAVAYEFAQGLSIAYIVIASVYQIRRVRGGNRAVA